MKKQNQNRNWRVLFEENHTLVAQLLKFGIVGFSNVVLGYFIYVISLRILKVIGVFDGHEFVAAQATMFIVTVPWSAYWNNRCVFKTNYRAGSEIVKVLLKSYAAYAFTSFFLSELLLAIWIKLLGINELIAPIINIALMIPINFAIQKHWTFNIKP